MTPFDSVERRQLEARSNSGARWFYVIAAFSLVTSVIALTGSHWVFLVSLAVTQIVDAMARGAATKVGGAAIAVALVFDFIAAGIFALVGYFASKRHTWAFVLGMVLYALDALLFLLLMLFAADTGLLIAVAFHAYALFQIFRGYQACARVAGLDRATFVAPPPPAPQSMS
jgi:hypothetical protein